MYFKLWIVTHNSLARAGSIIASLLFILSFTFCVLGSFVLVLWACPHYNIPKYLRLTLAIEQVYRHSCLL